MKQQTFGKPTPKQESDYAKRLKARFKRRLEELDSRKREADFVLMMPLQPKARREKARRDRKLILHKRVELLKEIKKTWAEYKGRK